MNRAIFLDRDGVINRKAAEGEYIDGLAAFAFLPGVLPALKLLHEHGFLLVIITNQRGVARGRVRPSALQEIHAYAAQIMDRNGSPLTAVYVCPHEEGCSCRKPQPGMILRAAQEHHLDLTASWMIGDSGSDILAGKEAGCHTMLVGAPASSRGIAVESELTAASLREGVSLLLAYEEQRTQRRK